MSSPVFSRAVKPNSYSRQQRRRQRLFLEWLESRCMMAAQDDSASLATMGPLSAHEMPRSVSPALHAQPATVVGRHLFYNQSAFDQQNPAINDADDGAIATDKHALLPGQAGTWDNYSSYSRGLNGIMIDVIGLANGFGITVQDFTFRSGNDASVGTWALAPSPLAVSVRPGAGLQQSDRVEIVWGNNAVHDAWLQVTLHANENTGLEFDDVFYFGNAIGESGDRAGDTRVDANDEQGPRQHPRAFFNPAPIDHPHDYNRDARVNVTDEIIARNRAADTGLAPLELFATPPRLPSPESVMASDNEFRDRIRISWSAVSSASGYEVWRSSNGDIDDAERIGVVSDTVFDDTSAFVNTSYVYWVRAVGASGNSGLGSPDTGQRGQPVVDDFPSGTAAAIYNVATGEIFVVVNDVTNWYIESASRRLTGAPVTDLPGPGLVTDSDTRIGEAALGQFSYAFYLGPVAAIGLPRSDLIIYWNSALGQPVQSGAVDFVGIPTIPLAPITVRASDGAIFDAIEIEWSMGVHATHYDVYRNTVNNPVTARRIAADVTINRLSDGSGLVARQTYYYWVVSKNWLGASGFSISDTGFIGNGLVVASVDTAVALYDVETGVIIVAANSVANWYVQSASEGLTGAEPVGLPAGGGLLTNFNSRIGETSLGEFTYQHKDIGPVAAPDLPEGDLILYFNAGLGQLLQRTPVQYIGGRIPIEASDEQYGDRVVVSWPVVDGALTYRVYRGSSRDFHSMQLLAEGVTDTTYIDTALTAGTIYYYRMQAVTAQGLSRYSQADVGSAAIPPPAPGGILASDGEYDDIVRVTWNAVAKATSYEVWRNTVNDVTAAQRIVDSTNSAVFEDASVTPGQRYFYWVRSVGVGGVGPFGIPDQGFVFVVSDQATATYNVATGEISVSVESVVNWYIESASASFTGTPVQMLPAGGGLVSDSDRRIGETALVNFSYANINLGPVAQPDLIPSDLKLFFDDELGGALARGIITFIGLNTPRSVQASDDLFADKISIAWMAVSGAVSYQIWRSESPTIDSAQRIADGLLVPGFDDTTAVPGQIYYYWARAVDANGQSPFSLPDAGAVAITPQAPGNVQASDGRFSEAIDVTWDAVAHATAYDVYRSTVPDTATARLIANNVSGWSYRDADQLLDPGQTYIYWVIARNVAGSSSFSLAETGFLQVALIAPIDTAVAQYDVETGGIVVGANSVANWYVQSASAGLTGAEPVGLPAGGGLLTNFNSRIGETGLAEFSYQNKDIGRVAAPDLPEGDLIIYWNAGLGQPLQSAPVRYIGGRISIQASDEQYGDRVVVSWPAVDGTLTYRVYRGSSRDFNSMQLLAQGVTDTTYIDTTLTAGTIYYYRMQPVTAQGLGQYSQADAGSAALPPPAPGGVLASDGEYDDIVRVTWNAVAKATSYEVWRNTVNDVITAQRIVDSTNSTVFEDASVTPGQRYFYWLRSVGVGGVGPFGLPDPGFVFVVSDQATASYNVATGEISVSVESVVNWYIESASASFTGTPVQMLPAGGGLVSDSDRRIGETALVNFSYANINLGPVAQPDLIPSDLQLFFDDELGGPLARGIITFIGLNTPRSVQASDDLFAEKITVAWMAVSGAAAYEIWRSETTTIDSAQRIAEGILVPGFDDTTAVPGQVYFYWVRAVGMNGQSPFSLPDAGAVAITPQAPGNVQASDGGFSEAIDVTWDAVAHATAYDVYRSTVPDTATARLIANNVSGWSYRDADQLLDPGQTYIYWVIARNVAGSSSFSLAETGFLQVALIAPIDTAVARYDVETGGIVVGANSVANWYVHSASAGLTGAEPVGLPAGGGLLTNFNSRIGETGLAEFSYQNKDIGTVAAPDLPEGDLIIYWNAGLGQPLQSAPVRYIGGRIPIEASDEQYGDRVVLRWPAVDGALSYRVYRGSSRDFNSMRLLAERVTDTTYIDTTLTTGTIYYYRIQPVTAQGLGRYSQADAGSAALPPPAPDGALASDGEYDDIVRVTWNAVANATSYEVWRNTVNDVTTAQRIVDSTNSTALEDASVTPGQRYFYWVRAVGAGGTSPYSPSDFGYAILTSDQVTASYDIASGVIIISAANVVNWYIESISNSLTGAPAQSLPAGGGRKTDSDRRIGETSLTDFGYANFDLGPVARPELSRDDLYMYFNDDLGKPLSRGTVTFVGLYSPRSVQASDHSYVDRVAVQWDGVDGADTYQLFRSDTSDPVSAQLLVEGLVDPHYDDTTAVPGQAYYYWVRAANADGLSALSRPDLGAVLGPPSAPQGVQATDGSLPNAIDITWNAVEHASSYEVWRNDFNDVASSRRIAEGVTGLSWRDADPTLFRGQAYVYWIIAGNIAGRSEFSTFDTGNLSSTISVSAEPSTAAAAYVVSTGEIAVSANDIVNWYIQSTSSGLTGVPVGDLPGPGLVTDNNSRLGETALGKFSYNVNLGNVAAPGLAQDDLRIYWHSSLGQPLQNAPVVYIPEIPSTGVEIQASDDEFTDRVRIGWPAIDGALSYEVFRGPSVDNATMTRIAAGLSATSYDDTSAAPGTEYFYRIRSITATGPGRFSRPDRGSIAPAPSPPYDPVVSSNRTVLFPPQAWRRRTPSTAAVSIDAAMADWRHGSPDD